MPRTFRFRLTLTFITLCALFMGAFSLFIYLFVARSLSGAVEEALTSEVNTAASLLPDEMKEAMGNAREGAKDVVSNLRFRKGILAIYAGGQLIASSGPVQERPELRSVTRRISIDGKTFELVARETPDGITTELSIIRNTILIALPLFLGLLCVVGYHAIRMSLRPLEFIAGQAQRITDRTLQTRIDPGTEDEELLALAGSFNGVLERIDRSFESMRRFVADASHELRTPLSIVRGEADLALSRERSPEQYRDALGIIWDEARRLSRLVEDLLNLARADAGFTAVDRHDFYLNDLLSECCRSVHVLAAARGIEIECQAAVDMPFCGDEELLRRLIVNLLDNAIRYTPSGGHVIAQASTAGTAACLRITDDGPGIPAEAAPHIFERFFRVDKVRTRADGGFGLGLAIVKWIAESHGGEAKLEAQTAPGSSFIVTLPM